MAYRNAHWQKIKMEEVKVTRKVNAVSGHHSTITGTASFFQDDPNNMILPFLKGGTTGNQTESGCHMIGDL